MQAVGRLFPSFHEKKQLIILFTCVFILKTQKLVKIICFLMVVNENVGCYFHEMLKKVSQVHALYTTYHPPKTQTHQYLSQSESRKYKRYLQKP